MATSVLSGNRVIPSDRVMRAALRRTSRASRPGRLVFHIGATVIATIMLGGCTAYNGALDAAGYTSKSAKILPVPYEKQPTEYLCGLAAADMVTRYYGVPLTTVERKRLEYAASHKGGISGRLLQSVLREDGYIALLFSGSLDDAVTGVYWHLDRRRPLIVMYAVRPHTPGHYVVVAGYDPARGTLVVLDPAIGRIVVSRERFAHYWAGSNRFMLLAVPTSKSKGR